MHLKQKSCEISWKELALGHGGAVPLPKPTVCGTWEGVARSQPTSRGEWAHLCPGALGCGVQGLEPQRSNAPPPARRGLLRLRAILYFVQASWDKHRKEEDRLAERGRNHTRITRISLPAFLWIKGQTKPYPKRDSTLYYGTSGRKVQGRALRS